jgi:hypothetical protein
MGNRRIFLGFHYPSIVVKLYGVVLRYSVPQPSTTLFRDYFSPSTPNQDNGAKTEPRSVTDQLDPHDLDAHSSRDNLGIVNR